MPHGILVRDSTRHRIGLQAAKELLDWLYADHPSREHAQLGFWKWVSGVTTTQARGPLQKNFAAIMAASAGWKWPQFQARLRTTVEMLLSQLDHPDKMAAVQTWRTLDTWKGPTGRSLLMWRPMLRTRPQAKDWAIYTLDELLADLHGVDTEALGRCARCERYYVRLRAGLGLYCSARCRYQTLNDKRGPQPKHKRRVGRRGVLEQAKR